MITRKYAIQINHKKYAFPLYPTKKKKRKENIKRKNKGGTSQRQNHMINQKKGISSQREDCGYSQKLSSGLWEGAFFFFISSCLAGFYTATS